MYLKFERNMSATRRLILAHEHGGICYTIGDIVIIQRFTDGITLMVTPSCQIRDNLLFCGAYELAYTKNITAMCMGNHQEYIKGYDLGRLYHHCDRRFYQSILDKLRETIQQSDKYIDSFGHVYTYWIAIDFRHIFIRDMRRTLDDILY